MRLVSAASPQTTKRRRVIGVPPTASCGTSPGLKPAASARRRSAVRTPSGHDAPTGTNAARGADTKARQASRIEARKGSTHPLEALVRPCRNGSRSGAEVRCRTLRLCARRDTRANEASRRSRKPFRASTDGRAVFVSHRKVRFRASAVARARTGEGAEATPGGKRSFGPGGAGAPSPAHRAVSRRRCFVFARQRSSPETTVALRADSHAPLASTAIFRLKMIYYRHGKRVENATACGGSD